MYNQLEKKISIIRNHLVTFNFISLFLCVISFYFIDNYIIIKSSHLLRGFGKSLGSIAAVCGGICLSYYIFREIYISNRKSLSNSINDIMKKTLTLLRLSHPVLGILMFYLIILHGSTMVISDKKSAESIFLFGIISAVISFLLMIIGININKSKYFRQYHKVLSIFFIISYLGHIFIRF